MAIVPVLNDIFELTDKQTFQGQEVFNVYFYEVGEIFVSTSATVAQVLAEGFISQILPVISNPQSIQLTHSEISVRNLYDPADQFTVSIAVPGLTSAPDVLPIFNAVGFQLSGETAAVKKGAKRLAGVPESAQTDGVITDTSYITALGNVGTAIAQPVQVGLILPSDVFFPVIVKRERSGVSGSYTYTLPSARGVGVKTRIISALFNVLVSSQISRKIGVGI